MMEMTLSIIVSPRQSTISGGDESVREYSSKGELAVEVASVVMSTKGFNKSDVRHHPFLRLQ